MLSTTIDKYIYITCRYLPPFLGTKHRVVWRYVEQVDSIAEILHPAVREGLRYLDFDDSLGIEMHYQGDLPSRVGHGVEFHLRRGDVAGADGSAGLEG